jgi:hypothetical protein
VRCKYNTRPFKVKDFYVLLSLENIPETSEMNIYLYRGGSAWDYHLE